MHFKITVYVKYDEKRMCLCIVKLSLGDLDPLGQRWTNVVSDISLPCPCVSGSADREFTAPRFFTPVYVKYSLYNRDCLFPVKVNSKKKNRKQTMFFNQERSLTF